MAETTEPRPKHKLRVPRARRGPLRILVGTRKGAFCVEGDAARQTWEVREPWHLGSTCFHIAGDPRGSRTVLAAVRTPAGEATVMVSEDDGKTWVAAERPPSFEPASETGSIWERRIHQVFWISPGHPLQPRVWFAGTSPQGLFRSDDGGHTWDPVLGLHADSRFDDWTSAGRDRTPDGPKLHSVVVDPRDAGHMLVALSSGGVLETMDAGDSWAPLPSEKESLPSDPHRVVMASTNPDVLWMQSHYGVYRMVMDEDRRWKHVGAGRAGPTMGDAGFPIAVHPSDPDCAWTMPMDGTDSWTRMSPGGRPALFRTKDAGATWQRQDSGLPREAAWWTVKRQCLAVDGFDPLGLYFGTTSGELWGSSDEGESWAPIATHLPHIYSVEVV